MACRWWQGSECTGRPSASHCKPGHLAMAHHAMPCHAVPSSAAHAPCSLPCARCCPRLHRLPCLDKRRIAQLGQPARDLRLAAAGGPNHEQVLGVDLLLWRAEAAEWGGGWGKTEDSKAGPAPPSISPPHTNHQHIDGLRERRKCPDSALTPPTHASAPAAGWGPCAAASGCAAHWPPPSWLPPAPRCSGPASPPPGAASAVPTSAPPPPTPHVARALAPPPPPPPPAGRPRWRAAGAGRRAGSWAAAVFLVPSCRLAAVLRPVGVGKCGEGCRRVQAAVAAAATAAASSKPPIPVPETRAQGIQPTSAPGHSPAGGRGP